MPRICFLIAVAALFAVAGLAQEPAPPPAGARVLLKSPQPLNSESGPIMLLQEPGGPENVFYLREMIGGEPVKGAPYTATAVTETTQVLGDGNRIVHKSSAFIARDGQGRTRREETFGELGALTLEGGKVVLISDPSTNTDYVLNPDEQSARVVKREGQRRELHREGAQMAELEARKKMLALEKHGSPAESAEFKAESLGTQAIEGVSCEGRRETKTIPAGAIGNERPLAITSESWISSDLHVLVLRKRNDPRLGETVYRLTNIKTGEPDPSLFQVPNGYKTTVVTEPHPPRE